MPSQPVGTPGTYGDQLRGKGVQIGPGVCRSVEHGERRSNAEFNGWERGVTGESRPGGGFMPYLDRGGNVIKNKAMSSGKYDKSKQALADLRSGAMTSGENRG